MNNEVIKVMNRKPESAREKAFRKWWKENGYKIKRVVFFPVWGALWAAEKVELWLDRKNNWDPKRADEILSYYIPRKASWNPETKEFYISHNSFGWNYSFVKKYLKLKDRRFWKNNTGWRGGIMRDYLVEKFELEGFEKSFGEYHDDDWTDIIFRLKE